MNSVIAQLQSLEDRKPLPKATLGSFVRSTANDLGIGKIASADSTQVVVEYFDSVGTNGRLRLTVDRDTIRRVRLPCQTRCWFERDGVWQTGRVVELLDSRYSIFLPSQKLAILPEPDFYVRWNRPLDDPMKVMAANGFDSPLFHELRRPFIDAMLDQRAISQGLSALTSSAIRLYPHQLAVAARVLLDDRQRYVLADEVGLGKTIEAGLILRQWLIDLPDPDVVVAVPKFLIHQWREELSTKFHIDDFKTATVEVVSHSALRHAVDRRPGVALVIDEAHRLMPGGEEYSPGSFSALQGAVATSRSLLLLTATPLLHNEESFLGMLHLIDPDTYRLEDLESFKGRVKDRQALALRVNGLQGATPDFLLQRHIAFLLDRYPKDALLKEHADRVLAEIAVGRTAAFGGAMSELREHVHDTYRLYQRVLRHRRSSEGTSTYEVRGRAGVERVVLQEDLRMMLNDLLDNWRLQLLSDHGSTHQALGALSVLVGCSTSAMCVVREGVQTRRMLATESKYLSPLHRRALLSLPMSDPEAAILERLAETLESEDAATSRVGQVVDLLGDVRSAEKVVVFTEYAGLAVDIAAGLTDVYGAASVAVHLDQWDADRVEEEVERFRTTRDCQFLVCDSSAEIGRNFQWADRVVHVDVPMSPNQLEQRLGRLDRHGDGSAVRSIACVDDAPGSFAAAWLTCLDRGFGVFDRSIASLQHPVDDAMTELLEGLLTRGVEAIDAASGYLPERLASELQDIESLEALESISDEGTYVRDLYQQLQQSDERWSYRQHAAEAWISDAPGNLRFHREVDARGRRRYLIHPPERTPRAETLPLISWDVLQREFEPWLDRLGTYSRELALSMPGTRLLGAGDPFIDALIAFSRWDTRGQAFAAWRRRRSWADQPELVAFRLDFVVGGDPRPATNLLIASDTLHISAVQRLVDRYFPPVVHTVWLDTYGVELADEVALRILQQPYDPSRGDAHLSPARRWALDDLLPMPWADTCMLIRERGEQAVRIAEPVRTAIEQVTERADRALLQLMSGRRLRAAADGLDVDDWSWLDPAVIERVKEGLVNPRLTLDAAGCVVIAGGFPTGWHDS